LQAEGLGVTQVDRAGDGLRLQLDARSPLPPGALVALVGGTPGAALAPDGTVRWPGGRETSPLGRLAAVLGNLERLLPSGAGSEYL
jgi:hypothetical protein